MQDETVVSKLKKAWIEALKSKSEDSKIYSFLRSRVAEENRGTEESQIKDYFALKALAVAKNKSLALHSAIAQNAAANATLERLKREVDIIDSFMPEKAGEDEVNIVIREAIENVIAQDGLFMVDTVMKIIAPGLAGRYSAEKAKEKVQQALLDEL
jgi:uncharacterized protein YqeY